MLNKIALSVDVEDWFHSRHVLSTDPDPIRNIQQFRDQYSLFPGQLERPLEDLLALYSARGIKATFFIVADLVKSYLPLLQKIVKLGHEIACHGLHHIEYRGPGSATEIAFFKSNIQKAKEILEDQLATEVIGFRAPSAYFRQWMIEPLLELGFKYDSSLAINSIFSKSKALNVPQTRAPFYWRSVSEEPALFEIPWPYYSLLGFKMPAGGGPALRLFGPTLMKLGLKQTLRETDTSFYIHPLDISSEPLPSIILDKRKYFWRNKGQKTYQWYQQLLDHFPGRFTTCQEIYRKSLKNHNE